MMEPKRQVACSLGLLLLLWCAGLFGRGYWTPDEPREAALAASMREDPRALPSLAGAPFAEKPPLSYWLAGESMERLGAKAPAARLPQLGYALMGFVAVWVLARLLIGDTLTSRTTAPAAALVFATGALAYQVQVWLDTDALLLAGVAMALAGMYAALAIAERGAGTRNARWRAYLVMHVGLTLAFFAKNFAAWLVPVLTFLCFIVWERRWRELARWELYLGALLPASCIVLWALAVAAQPNGSQLLRVLFWNNLFGRALPIAAEARFNYASGHANSPGKYLIELPLYLLPWTAVAGAALCAAWPGARRAGPRRSAWRFALCAAVPGLLVLSLATTARGIYAAPCMVGFALLVGLWAADAVRTRRALTVTAVLIATLATVVLTGTLALQVTVLRSSDAALCLSVLAAIAAIAASFRTGFYPGPSAAIDIRRLAVSWSVLLSLGTLSLIGAANSIQDLPMLASRVAQAAGAKPLLLWAPDETTLAWAQLYLPSGSWSAMDGADAPAGAELAGRLHDAPNTVVVSLIPGHGWSWVQWRAYLRGHEAMTDTSRRPISKSPPQPVLSAAGWEESARIERPGGRGYLLWSRRGGEP
jgi:4-amino-4-deoxy-L-arabinose transferase-like glycosyltransferase